MSLYQCEHCGCCENTALGHYWGADCPNSFDWRGIEDRCGKKLCSACGPKQYSDGIPTDLGEWHRKFDRAFLPMGMFKTNARGNLEHIETGSEDFRAYAIEKEA
jgi:hypothetical protein